jgi:hypothetical protein
MRKYGKETGMSSHHGVVLDAVPTWREFLTPQEFLRLDRSQKDKIAEVTIAPGRLGEKNFGGLWVRYKSPIYRIDTK